MAETPDLDGLAKRYLDLWQEQFAAMAADPKLAEAMTQWLGLMGLGRTAPGAARGQHDRHGPARAGAAQPASQPAAAQSSAPRPDTPAAAPDLGRAGTAELADRLAALEQRLAALESRLDGTGGGSSSARSQSVNPERFAAAVDAEARRRFADFLDRRSSFIAAIPIAGAWPSRRVIWREGASRLLAYERPAPRARRSWSCRR